MVLLTKGKGLVANLEAKVAKVLTNWGLKVGQRWHFVGKVENCRDQAGQLLWPIPAPAIAIRLDYNI